MFLFSWKKIYKNSQGSAHECFIIFRMLVNKEIPTNRKDVIYNYSLMDFTGTDYLVNPKDVLYNAYKYTEREIAIYLALASHRKLAEYGAEGLLTLDLLHLPNKPIYKTTIKQNRLLSLENDRIIHFLYEEVPRRK
jgi:hypothetical protein